MSLCLCSNYPTDWGFNERRFGVLFYLPFIYIGILLCGDKRVMSMSLSYKTVVEYVKNLFPGAAPVAPSDNPQIDAQVVAYKSSNRFYISASNGCHYWYCFVDEGDIPLVKYILRSNGVQASAHNSRYFFGREPVLRVRTSKLARVPAGRAFVDLVMGIDESKLNVPQITLRINQIQQKMK